jgi:putative tryptophan/tyrosine transport system substrate-binding protein
MLFDRLRRREFITLLGGVSASWAVVARAQQPARVFRIGFLGFGNPSAWVNRVEALRGGLRDLGHIDGKNIVVEFRGTETIEQLPELATELVRMNVDVIFAPSSTEVEVARQVTNAIPIVFATHADPVGLGHVASFARPGGNITGLSGLGADLAVKALEILKEAVPYATRFAVFLTPSAPWHRSFLQAAQVAGAKLGVQVHTAPVQTVEDLDAAFAMAVRERVDGIFVQPTSLSRSHRAPLAELALKHRLPSMFGGREYVEAGGLMSYAADYVDLTRRAATYIDKILKGARPADLPVELASKYLLVINLITAKKLELNLPWFLEQRADEVIE